MTSKAVSLAKSLFKDVETKNLFIKVETNNKLLNISYEYHKGKNVEPANTSDKKKDILSGYIDAEVASGKPDKNLGECYGAYIIEKSEVNKPGGHGRLLYYIAMHFAGDKGIAPDRILSSEFAVRAWNYLFDDPEVTKKLLDNFYEPHRTPETTEDDCNLASSGFYLDNFKMSDLGELETDNPKDINLPKTVHSQSSYYWNLNLADKEYRDIKASKLNYVYVADSSDLIEYLTSINIPVAVNGEEPKFNLQSSIKESRKPKKISLSSIIFNR